MKNIAKFVVGMWIMVSIPMITFADSNVIEGVVKGYNCTTKGENCPVDNDDPVISNERVFVVQVENHEFYFVPNVNRSLLSDYVNEIVKIHGDLSPKHNSIHASKIECLRKGSWEEIWFSLSDISNSRSIQGEYMIYLNKKP